MSMKSTNVSTYADLRRYVQGIARRDLNFVLIVGPPGTAKTRIVKDVLGANACFVEGNATAFGIYRKLYENRGKTVVIDDVDAIYRDKAAVRLLKALCQTESAKTIAWTSQAAGTDEIPSEFTTTSNVCIITNSWRLLDANVKALADRGHLLHFKPTPREIHTRVASWYWDREIYHWVEDHLQYLPRLSMRDYVKASELKKIGIDWRGMLLSHVPAAERAVLEIVGDDQLASEAERVTAFMKRTGKSRATYFNVKKRLTVAV